MASGVELISAEACLGITNRTALLAMIKEKGVMIFSWRSLCLVSFLLP